MFYSFTKEHIVLIVKRKTLRTFKQEVQTHKIKSLKEMLNNNFFDLIIKYVYVCINISNDTFIRSKRLHQTIYKLIIYGSRVFINFL